MSTATLLHMPKERFHNMTKRATKPKDPQIPTTFGCPASYVEEIEEAAEIVNWGKGHFISIAAHEYAKTVIAISKAKKKLDHNQIQDLAFATIRTARQPYEE